MQMSAVMIMTIKTDIRTEAIIIMSLSEMVAFDTTVMFGRRAKVMAAMMLFFVVAVAPTPFTLVVAVVALTAIFVTVSIGDVVIFFDVFVSVVTVVVSAKVDAAASVVAFVALVVVIFAAALLSYSLLFICTDEVVFGDAVIMMNACVFNAFEVVMRAVLTVILEKVVRALLAELMSLLVACAACEALVGLV